MNDTIKTIIYVSVGAVLALAAFLTRPSLKDSSDADPNDSRSVIVGKQIFPDFDPVKAKSLAITKFDDSAGEPKTFSVVQLPSGRWVIPSHNDYPADAEQQMGAMGSALLNLKALDVASESEGDHEMFGVVDPSKAQVGGKGIGTLLAMQDAKDADILKLIVGNEVDGSPGQRFVRKPNDPKVLVTAVDLTKLPTEFEKWIEKDLLKISTFDVSRLTLKDYIITQTEEGLEKQDRMQADLQYASDKGEWLLDRMQIKSQPRAPWKDAPLGEQEELNKQKLDDLRNALGDVKIVDVKRKPAGLGNAVRMKSEDLTRESLDTMLKYGFFTRAGSDGLVDIYSVSGEVVVETKEGVQYVLRFGKIAPEVNLGIVSKSADGEKTEEHKIKSHRYLFVTTQVAPSVLTLPTLEPEPEAPAAPIEAKPADAGKADGKAGENKQPPVIDPKQAELERVRNENKRKMDAYNDKKKKAEARVKELNGRFADWYYVVAEDVYKKIHLVRSDIVKEATAAKDEGYGIDAFRSLEQGGLKGAAKPPGGPGGPGPSFPNFPPM